METLRRLECRFSIVKFAGREVQQVLKELDVPVSEKLGEQILEAFVYQGGSYSADGFKFALTHGFESKLRALDRNCRYARAVRELPFITPCPGGPTRTRARTHPRTHARARAHTHTHTHILSAACVTDDLVALLLLGLL
jgi:hypothetical protein